MSLHYGLYLTFTYFWTNSEIYATFLQPYVTFL